MTRKEAVARNEFADIISREAGFRDAERVADLICRHGRTYARLQEMNCNGVDGALPNDQAKFAAWVAKREKQVETLILHKCQELGEGFNPIFSGDPRGNTVKIRVPSGKTNDWGQEGISVPTS